MIVKLLFKLEYIENYASGLTRIFSEYKNYDFKPKVESSLISLKLTLPNCNFNTALENKFNVPDGTLNDTLNGTLNNQADEMLLKLYSIIEKNPGINRKTLVNQLGISTRSLARYLSVLINENDIIRYGSKKSGGYKTNKQQNNNTVMKSSNHSFGTLNDDINGTLNNQPYEIFLKLYSTIEKNPGINRKTLANQLGISTRTLARYLSILIDKHYIIREGSKKTGGYRMVTQDDSMTYKD